MNTAFAFPLRGRWPLPSPARQRSDEVEVGSSERSFPKRSGSHLIRHPARGGSPGDTFPSRGRHGAAASSPPGEGMRRAACTGRRGARGRSPTFQSVPQAHLHSSFFRIHCILLPGHGVERVGEGHAGTVHAGGDGLARRDGGGGEVQALVRGKIRPARDVVRGDGFRHRL